jgi:hypothetical protein
VTAPEAIINNFTFYVVGAPVGAADNIQPMLTMTVVGYVQVSATQQSTFHLQTSVTQRIYDQ